MGETVRSSMVEVEDIVTGVNLYSTAQRREDIALSWYYSVLEYQVMVVIHSCVIVYVLHI